ncbi:MAG: Gfo/Idh/MocA family oxidoreductase [Planctomycetaceae bacterium]|nr:Gfo/Idh/MocA family oxidoreductase [Planctomycetaceae bacterium]
MSHVTRRRFLEDSLLATAVTAVSSTVPAFATAAEETSRTSANETLQHAVLGCRIRGKVHAAEFGKLPGVNVAYVCDPDLTLAEELAAAVEKQSGRKPKVVQDLRKIIDDKSIDTISIAAPNHWHALAAMWGMQAGKDVYVEKPVSHNLVEGRRMVDAAKKLKRICQGGTQNRSVGGLMAAAEFIRAGKLGEVKLARSIIYGKRASIGEKQACVIPTGCDFNLWLGPATQQPLQRKNMHYDWHWVWDTGNGELGNNNIHMVDICRWLVGLEGLGDSVISIGGRLGYEDAGETPNTQLTVHQFGPTTVIQEVRGLKTAPFSDKFKSGYVIYGSEGFIADATLFDPSGKLVQKFEGKGENHFANFIRAVRSRNPNDLNAEITKGHISTGLCHVANISHRLGQQVTVADIKSHLSGKQFSDEVRATFTRMVAHLGENEVDLDRTKLTLGSQLTIDSAKEQFVENSAANALLKREYRAPFVLPSADQI